MDPYISIRNECHLYKQSPNVLKESYFPYAITKLTNRLIAIYTKDKCVKIVQLPTFKIVKVLETYCGQFWCGFKKGNRYYFGFEQGILVFDLKRLIALSKKISFSSRVQTIKPIQQPIYYIG